jgi:hypothetical protein
MPIIIWGSRGVTSTLDQGEFYCPECDDREEYVLKQVRPFFTLFFIPIFPIGAAQRYLECRGCGNAFSEEVLDYRPPSERDRLLARFYDELRSGTCLEVLRRKLVSRGMDEEAAEKALVEMCDGVPIQCQCRRRYHPRVRECSECGAKL